MTLRNATDKQMPQVIKTHNKESTAMLASGIMFTTVLF